MIDWLNHTDPNSLQETFESNQGNVYQVIASSMPSYPKLPPHEITSLAICTDHTDFYSGHSAAVARMADQLSGFGYRTVICMPQIPPKELAASKSTYVSIPKIQDTSYKERIGAFERIIESHDVEAVILNSYMGQNKYWDLLAIKSIALKRGRSIVVVLHMHNTFARLAFDLGSRWLWNNSDLFCYFDAIIALSDVDAEFFRLFNPNTFVRPLPIDYSASAMQPTATSKNAYTALYLARVSQDKNQTAAIRAFSSVVNKLPNARLIIAGNANAKYKKKCEKLITSLHLENNVEIRDFVSGEEKAQLLRSSTLMISTSLYEGYCQSFAEAKACGLPIVAFDLPNQTLFDEGAANGVLTVKPHDRNALADTIIAVMTNASLRSELSAGGVNHAKKLESFDYENFWFDVFHNLKSDDIIQEQDNDTERRMVRSLIYAEYWRSLLLKRERKSYEAQIAESKSEQKQTIHHTATKPDLLSTLKNMAGTWGRQGESQRRRITRLLKQYLSEPN